MPCLEMLTAAPTPTQTLRAARFPRPARPGGRLPMADTRTTQVPGDADDRAERSGYHVDATAVAAAIVDRLAAGGALPPLCGAEAREGRAR
jgi:hypothetical protein